MASPYDNIIDINRIVRVRDTLSEAGNPNQNPAETLGVKIIKQGSEGLMNRCGAPDFVLQYSHKYIADINNHRASQFLGWKTPISKLNEYTPDISAYLLYMFWEAIYYKAKDKFPNSTKRKERLLGVSHHVEDMLTYFLYC